jgi:membrane-associated protease RseP (regulator of RpoE activity)
MFFKSLVMNMQILKLLLILVLVFLNACVGPTTQRVKPNDAAVAIEAEKQREIALKEVLRSQNRLLSIGAPILKKSLPFCKDRKRKSIGITFANKYDFEGEYLEIAISKLGLGEALEITYVIESNPAANAGLKSGDVLLSVNDKSVPIGKDASKKFSELLKKEIKDNTQLSFQIIRNDITESFNVTPVENCDYPLIVAGDNAVNAFADGNSIYVTQGMMDFTKSDDELALVVGHELAHNAMRHIDAKRTNALGGFVLDMLILILGGVDTQGTFTKGFAQAYSQEFESEADYVGLYMCEFAGYNISDAAYFWRRMGVKHPGSIDKNHAASHPSSPERFVSIEDTIKEIEQKKTTGETLMPNIDEDALDERDPPPDNPANKIGF